MKSRFFRYLGIALLTLGILGIAVTGINNGSNFLADPGYYPERPGGPPWSAEFGPYSPPQGWQDPQEINPQESFSSNGESIYFSLVTLEGEPIIAQAKSVGRRGADLSCAGCHGRNGQGGYLELGRWSSIVPAIDTETLQANLGEKDMLRPAYTDKTLGQAITRGVNSAGKNLDYSMPRFQLKSKDLHDLITFLKTLRAAG